MIKTHPGTDIADNNLEFLRLTASVEDFSVYDWLTDQQVQIIIRELAFLKGLNPQVIGHIKT